VRVAQAWAASDHSEAAKASLSPRLRSIRAAIDALRDGRVSLVREAAEEAATRGDVDVAGLLAQVQRPRQDPSELRRNAKRQRLHRHAGDWWLDLVRLIEARRVEFAVVPDLSPRLRKQGHDRPYLSKLTEQLTRTTVQHVPRQGEVRWQVLWVLGELLDGWAVSGERLRREYRGTDLLHLDSGWDDPGGPFAELEAGGAPPMDPAEVHAYLPGRPSGQAMGWLGAVVRWIHANFTEAPLAQLANASGLAFLLATHAEAPEPLAVQLSVLHGRLSWAATDHVPSNMLEAVWAHAPLDLPARRAIAPLVLDEVDPFEAHHKAAWSVLAAHESDPREIVELMYLVDEFPDVSARIERTARYGAEPARVRLLRALHAALQRRVEALGTLPTLLQELPVEQVMLVSEAWRLDHGLDASSAERRAAAQVLRRLSPQLHTRAGRTIAADLVVVVGTVPPEIRTALTAPDAAAVAPGITAWMLYRAGEADALAALLRREGRRLRGLGAGATTAALRTVAAVYERGGDGGLAEATAPLTRFVLREGFEAVIAAVPDDSPHAAGMSEWARCAAPELAENPEWVDQLDLPDIHDDDDDDDFTLDLGHVPPAAMVAELRAMAQEMGMSLQMLVDLALSDFGAAQMPPDMVAALRSIGDFDG
jgi:hypothetical protein